jgi:serine phosphatase RsbU (regulator of sigma subunit)
MRLRRRLSDPHRSWRPGHALVAIPLALIVAITVADVLTPPEIVLSPLLITAPALTASFAGPWLTSLVCALTIADEVLLDLQGHILGTRAVQAQLAALVVVSVFLVMFAFVRDRHRRQLTRIRSVSEAAQRALLRPLPSRLGTLRLASMYLAAEEEAQIGGDLYAAARTPAGTRVVIGDVRGKGLPSVSEAALLLGAFREAARRHAGLLEIAMYLDESVRTDLEEHAEEFEEASENFITAMVLHISDDWPTVDLVSCGHPPPLLIRDGRMDALQVSRPGPPLGLGELSRYGYHVETFTFEEGDTLLLYTDGVIEARDRGGAFYPLVERVLTWSGDGPETLVDHIRGDLLAYVGGRLGDDAAMVAIQRLRVGRL